MSARRRKAASISLDGSCNVQCVGGNVYHHHRRRTSYNKHWLYFRRLSLGRLLWVHAVFLMMVNQVILCKTVQTGNTAALYPSRDITKGNAWAIHGRCCSRTQE